MKFLYYIYFFIALFSIVSCGKTQELLTNKLALKELFINGKSVNFDNTKDFFVYDVDKNDTDVRLSMDVINYKKDVFFHIEQDGVSISNYGNNPLFKRINKFVVKIENIRGDKKDFIIYITKGRLPELFIEDNFIHETTNNSGTINVSRSIKIADNDFPSAVTFKGVLGDDFLSQKKSKIKDIANINAKDFNTFIDLKEVQTSNTTVTLEMKNTTELEFKLIGKYKTDTLKGFIDIYFEQGAFNFTSGVDELLLIEYNNTYFFRYSLGDALLKFSTLVLNVNAQREVTGNVTFTLSGAKFKKSGSFSSDDDTFVVTNLPYDYEPVITVNANLITGKLEIKRKNLFLEKKYETFSLKFKEKMFDGIDIEKTAGRHQRFLLVSP